MPLCSKPSWHKTSSTSWGLTVRPFAPWTLFLAEIRITKVSEKYAVWMARAMILFPSILSSHLTTIFLAPSLLPSPLQDVWHPMSGMKSYGSTFSARLWQQVSTWLAIPGNMKFHLFVSKDKEGCSSLCWKGASLHLAGVFLKRRWIHLSWIIQEKYFYRIMYCKSTFHVCMSFRCFVVLNLLLALRRSTGSNLHFAS